MKVKNQVDQEMQVKLGWPRDLLWYKLWNKTYLFLKNKLNRQKYFWFQIPGKKKLY